MENEFSNRISVKNIVLAGMFAAFLAVMSQVSLPMPTGVPITVQVFAVALVGVILGWKRGVLAVLVYILIGAVGVPVGTGDIAGGFEQQRGFADARLSGDQHYGTRNDAAAEYAVEFLESGGDAFHTVRCDIGDRGGGARRDGVACLGPRGAPRFRCTGACGRACLVEFLDRPPLAAFGATAHPFRAAPTAF